MMLEFYDDTFALPERLFEADDLECGRFIALNLLATRMPDDSMVKIGRALRSVSPLKAIEGLGLLLLVDCKTPYLPKFLEPVYLPIRESLFWDLILALPPSRAVPLAIKALGMEGEPKFIEDLVQEARETSVARSVHDFLKSTSSPLLHRADLAHVLDILEDIDDSALMALKPTPMGQNVIQLFDEHGKSDSVMLQGFHPMEATGVWTAKKEALLFLRVPDGQHVVELTGEVEFFGLGVVDGEVLSVEVTEQAGGRTKVLERQYVVGDPKVMAWDLSLPSFSGVLKIMISTQNLYSPKAVSSSMDQRNLGVMCRDLKLVAR
jgi:hypothetical protein